MRAIKFRAWDINNKKMFRINRIDYRDDNLEIREVRRASELPINIADQMYYDLLEIELMQYTGLKDKNGVEIYEGDIVEYYHRDNLECTKEISDVVWFDEMWSYPAFDLNGTHIKEHFFEGNALSEIISTGNYHYEVIGNIYEHPHLLKE